MRKFNPNEVKFIQNRACERIVEILDAIGTDYTERHDYLQFQCPIHNGNNYRSAFWAIQSKHFECKTRGCHLDIISGPSSSIFGLVRGAMTNKTNEVFNFQQAVNFVAQVLGLEECCENESSVQDVEVAKLIKAHKKRQLTVQKPGIPLSEMIPYLKPDQVYYPNRGISQEIIDKYHISFCDTRGKPMYKRAFFPILDTTGRYIIGWSGRSIYDKCPECNMYHHPERPSCPDSKYNSTYTKWKHSEGFRATSCLYNIWYAKPFINKTGTAILCEGPGDTWALEMAGIRNSVALFGTSMSHQQRLALQNTGALTIVCMFDNDEAGKKGMRKIEKDLIHYFRIFCITPETVNDIGEMFSEDIKTKIGPVLEKTSRVSCCEVEN